MRTTTKHSNQYQRKYEGLPMWIGYIWIGLIVAGLIANAYLQATKKPLISPLAKVETVYAKEPSYKVSCEDPKGYLECKVYKQEITWDQHDKIAKIINCESKWNADAIHVNTNGSVDMGLVQINSVHKNITNADKLDFKKAIDWMINKIKKDGGFGAWRSSIKCHGVK